ncbi:NAD(P)-binding protein [Mytilinidion resinicola]|uniref:NAD(P)-binding protein n=1 Tax=Mytilinidion resinicola TaxID=574789 RepID=A0A6A6Y2D3_9PEZI|nr:NAD(P)-binding protein [Mytilinidion resinicola]KAF2802942.1 NAD(P)-binding protein [Mytilinidion resinicola]
MSPSDQTILVTGANGFVASHVVRTLLAAGYNVRAAVRSTSSTERMKEIHAPYVSQLSFIIVPDMTAPGAFDEAVKRVSGIMHMASPFVLAPENNEVDLLQPAIQITLGVLASAAAAGSTVRHVVLTSSFASILDMGQGYRPGYTYNEADWNPMTYAEAAVADGPMAYCASKKLAEEAAWNFVKEKKPAFELSTICPPWIFGPTLGSLASLEHLNESTEAIYKLINAKSIPPIDFAGFADVRDVAAAHLRAYEKPEAAGKRFLVGNHFDYQTAADAIRAKLPELKDRVPEGTPGAGLKGDVYQVDGSEAAKVLGVEYTKLEDTMKDTVEGLLEAEKRLGVEVH